MAAARSGTALLDPEDRDWTPVFHPIIRTHPETGRKSLYFDPGKIARIVGLDEAESDALIAELKGCMIQPDAEYRHKWRKGDIVIWDNRCSYHKAAGDYPPEEDRIHWRVRSTISASKPWRRRIDTRRAAKSSRSQPGSPQRADAPEPNRGSRLSGGDRRWGRLAGAEAKRSSRRAATRGLTKCETSPPSAPISLTKRDEMNW